MKTVVSNSTFDRGSLAATYIKPFDVFAMEAKLESGSPHWTISATGSPVQRRRLSFHPSRCRNANLSIRSLGWATFTGAYVLSWAHGDTNGATSFPSNASDLETDYGRTVFDVRQRLTLFMGIDGPGFRLVPSISASSGQPFDITVGQDRNGDSIFNDRPAFATDLSRPGVVMTPFGAFDTAPTAGQRIIPRNLGTGPARSPSTCGR